MTKCDFFSGISASWDEQHSAPEEQDRLRSFCDHFRLQPGDRILDAGCGSGRLVPVICEQIGPAGRLTELDFAPGMIEVGLGKPHGDNVAFVLGDAHDLHLPAHDFDKVIALALLPHLADKHKALKEFRRVLKPGGMLVIAHQMGREALDRLHAECSEPVRHDRLPDKAELEALLVAAGYSNVKVLDEPKQYVAWAQA